MDVVKSSSVESTVSLALSASNLPFSTTIKVDTACLLSQCREDGECVYSVISIFVHISEGHCPGLVEGTETYCVQCSSSIWRVEACLRGSSAVSLLHLTQMAKTPVESNGLGSRAASNFSVV